MIAHFGGLTGEKRVAIRCGVRDGLGGDGAACARAIFRMDRLAEHVA